MGWDRSLLCTWNSPTGFWLAFIGNTNHSRSCLYKWPHFAFSIITFWTLSGNIYYNNSWSGSAEESNSDRWFRIPNILQCTLLLPLPFCFLRGSANELPPSVLLSVEVWHCQQQKLVGVSEARPVQHLSLVVQISYCKCQMLQWPGKETTGREHIIMHWIPAEVQWYTVTW